MTDTARHADVVLPATTQLEHFDAHWSWGHHYVSYNEPAIAPRGQACANTETFRRLAARLGLEDPCFRESDEEMLAELFEGSPVSLAELRERGWVKIEAPVRFGTADGRIALRADRLADAGVDPLPFYDPPAEPPDERHPLALITPKTHLFLNTTFADQRRQHAAQPEPFVVVEPGDARARGIAGGELVRVFNDRGAFTARARVSDDTRAGVVVAPMGWWNRDYPDGAGAQATTSQRLTTLGRAPIFNDNRVQVEKV
jgi:anaerobic selenocysteine-containing dehydrogenase